MKYTLGYLKDFPNVTPINLTESNMGQCADHYHKIVIFAELITGEDWYLRWPWRTIKIRSYHTRKRQKLWLRPSLVKQTCLFSGEWCLISARYPDTVNRTDRSWSTWEESLNMCFIRPTVYGGKLLAKLDRLDKNCRSSWSEWNTDAVTVSNELRAKQHFFCFFSTADTNIIGPTVPSRLIITHGNLSHSLHFPFRSKEILLVEKKNSRVQTSQSVSQPSAHFNKQLQGLFLHVCMLVCVDVHAH